MSPQNKTDIPPDPCKSSCGKTLQVVAESAIYNTVGSWWQVYSVSTNLCFFSANQEPHFKTGDLVVDEFAGMVMVCVLGGQGNARRSLGIYTAKGMDERCPRRPCPPATGILIASLGATHTVMVYTQTHTGAYVPHNACCMPATPIIVYTPNSVCTVTKWLV